MANFIFLVRPWNVDFFISLSETLKNQDPDLQFIFFTMHLDAYDELLNRQLNVIYLPFEFEKYGNEVALYNQLDKELHNKYSYGINYIYETERFIPEEYDIKLITGHLVGLYKIIPAFSTLISLSMDHFTYILAGHVNEIKGGKNYYVQPVGFPVNANVIHSTPWKINCFRTNPLDKSVLDDFIVSLSKPPWETILYMKLEPQIRRESNVIDKIIARYKLFKRWQLNKRIISKYQYLEPIQPFPSLFYPKPSIWNEQSYTISSLTELSKKARLFFFPLQFEPEMSILAYSPFYKDQIEIIRLLSMSVFADDYIVLKENPAMLGKRPNGYFETIRKFPNVIWTDFESNSREIIKISYKVICITGTASIEAACLGVSSIIFGYPSFRKLLKCDCMSEKPINQFRKILYAEEESKEIVQKVYEEWDEYSRSIFIGNFLPEYIGSRLTIPEVEVLVNSFVSEVLKPGV
jgi:hypothetical protein